MKKLFNKKFLVCICVVTCMFAFSSFAAETVPSVETAMGDAMSGIKDDLMKVIAIVAPVGVGIAGVVLAWKKGFGFFKSVSK